MSHFHPPISPWDQCYVQATSTQQSPVPAPTYAHIHSLRDLAKTHPAEAAQFAIERGVPLEQVFDNIEHIELKPKPIVWELENA